MLTINQPSRFFSPPTSSAIGRFALRAAARKRALATGRFAVRTVSRTTRRTLGFIGTGSASSLDVFGQQFAAPVDEMLGPPLRGVLLGELDTAPAHLDPVCRVGVGYPAHRGGEMIGPVRRDDPAVVAVQHQSEGGATCARADDCLPG